MNAPISKAASVESPDGPDGLMPGWSAVGNAAGVWIGYVSPENKAKPPFRWSPEAGPFDSQADAISYLEQQWATQGRSASKTALRGDEGPPHIEDDEYGKLWGRWHAAGQPGTFEEWRKQQTASRKTAATFEKSRASNDRGWIVTVLDGSSVLDRFTIFDTDGVSVDDAIANWDPAAAAAPEGMGDKIDRLFGEASKTAAQGSPDWQKGYADGMKAVWPDPDDLSVPQIATGFDEPEVWTEDYGDGFNAANDERADAERAGRSSGKGIPESVLRDQFGPAYESWASLKQAEVVPSSGEKGPNGYSLPDVTVTDPDAKKTFEMGWTQDANGNDVPVVQENINATARLAGESDEEFVFRTGSRSVPGTVERTVTASAPSFGSMAVEGSLTVESGTIWGSTLWYDIDKTAGKFDVRFNDDSGLYNDVPATKKFATLDLAKAHVTEIEKTGSVKVAWTADMSDVTPTAAKVMAIVDGLQGTDDYGAVDAPEAEIAAALAPFASQLTPADIACLEDYNYHVVVRALQITGSRKQAATGDTYPCSGCGTPTVQTDGGWGSLVLCDRCIATEKARSDASNAANARLIQWRAENPGATHDPEWAATMYASRKQAILFGSPAEHADNPPESWVVEKAGDRLWHLKTKGGGVLEGFPTKSEAEAHKSSGFYFNLYKKDGDWYSGITPPGMKAYDPVTNRAVSGSQHQADAAHGNEWTGTDYNNAPNPGPDYDGQKDIPMSLTPVMGYDDDSMFDPDDIEHPAPSGAAKTSSIAYSEHDDSIFF